MWRCQRPWSAKMNRVKGVESQREQKRWRIITYPSVSVMSEVIEFVMEGRAKGGEACEEAPEAVEEG